MPHQETPLSSGDAQFSRAQLWHAIVRLLRENGLVVRPGQREDVAALEAVTTAFAAARLGAASTRKDS